LQKLVPVKHKAVWESLIEAKNTHTHVFLKGGVFPTSTHIHMSGFVVSPFYFVTLDLISLSLFFCVLFDSVFLFEFLVFLCYWFELGFILSALASP